MSGHFRDGFGSGHGDTKSVIRSEAVAFKPAILILLRDCNAKLLLKKSSIKRRAVGQSQGRSEAIFVDCLEAGLRMIFFDDLLSFLKLGVELLDLGRLFNVSGVGILEFGRHGFSFFLDE